MANKVFKHILDEKIENFKFAFQNTSKNIFWNEETKQLTHPGEYGMYRESVSKQLLRLIIPGKLEIGNGFLINHNEEVSTQCDVVVYDKSATPLIENDERQRFFPVQTVCSIGEIKSDLDKAGLKEAMNKLARNKAVRNGMIRPIPIKRDIGDKLPFEPLRFPYDNLFSFIICNKLKFDTSKLHEEIDSFYDADILPGLKHNLILSINDGLLTYFDGNNVTFHYPADSNGNPFKNRFIPPDHNPNIHFYFFCSFMFMGTTSGSIYFPDISNFLNGYV